MIDKIVGSDVRIDDGTEPAAHSTPKYDLLRCEPGKPIGGVVLDESPLKVYTHWYGGRTIPCLWNDCKACEAHRRPDWRGYFTVFSLRTCNIAVIEVTEACRDTMARWETLHSHWRGAVISVRRVGAMKNSRLSLSISLGNTPAETLPQPIDLMDYMCRLWGAAAHSSDQTRTGEPAYNAALSRAQAAAFDQGLIRQHP